MAVPAARMYPAQVYTRSMDIILAPIASRVSINVQFSIRFRYCYERCQCGDFVTTCIVVDNLVVSVDVV